MFGGSNVAEERRRDIIDGHEEVLGMKFDILVVGAGFSGSVCAERMAAAGKRVLLIDKRNHIGGNAYDRLDDHGVLIHPYGPHIFHTNSKRIFEYLSRFTAWRFYEHRVLAEVEGVLYPIPINRTTINRLYRLDLTEEEVERYLDGVRLPRQQILTSEDVVLSSVGPDLCEKFFRGYTRKQWGLDLSQLSAGVAARIPTRTNDDDRYFSDTYQFMPADGYTALFRRMLNHPLIELQLECGYVEASQQGEFDHVFFTGPIDEFFEYRFGRLSYRSLRFEHEHIYDKKQFQETGTINFPNDHDYTRITEFRHLTGQRHPGTSIVREFPQSEGDPYYPIPTIENHDLYTRYKDLAAQTAGVTFVGRMAEYRYYNMDQAVGAALAAINRLLSS
jgi:UDP-galactopyranose mutase